MRTDKASTLRFGGIYASGMRESDMFVPNERNASAEALICLTCPLPKCSKANCERFKEEKKRLKGK